MAKRLFDLILAGLGLALTGPLLLGLAALIRLEDGGPVFYRGERVARGGGIFRIFKFRTMVLNADKMGASSTAEDDPRITRVGRFIRRAKIDELPQLLNVFAGDMSLVGPRPQVAWAVALLNGVERRVLEMRPGITDYASIRFRNEGEILKGSKDPDKDYLEKIAPEKTRLQLEYLQRQSVLEDLRIIAATALAVLGGDPEKILRIPGPRHGAPAS